MAVYSGRPTQNGWLAVPLALLLVIAGTIFSPAIAQQPTTDADTTVEEWVGTRKIPSPIVPIPVTLPAPPSSPASEVLPAVVQEKVPTYAPPPPIVPAIVVPESSKRSRKRTTPEDDPKIVQQTSARSVVAAEDKQPVRVELQVRSEPSQHPAPAPLPATVTVPHDTSSLPAPAPYWYESVWLPVLVVGAAILAAPFLLAFAFVFFVRQTGVQLRVEVVNSGTQAPIAMMPMMQLAGIMPGMVPQMQPQSAVPSTSPTPDAPPSQEGQTTDPAKAEYEEPFTAEEFDLGPSFEEEMQQKAQAQEQMELAVLQQIFEENLRLQKELQLLPAQRIEAAEPEQADEFAGYQSEETQCPEISDVAQESLDETTAPDEPSPSDPTEVNHDTELEFVS